MAKKSDKDSRFSRMRSAFDRAVTADKDNRQMALDDVRFVWQEGYQWDAKLRKDRQQEGRPCFEFNKLKPTIKQVLNDQRQNRPQVKVRAVEDGDVELAEVMQGLIRNIEASSCADEAYDEAYRFAVTGGYGVWRITTDYERDDVFEQCIKIEPVRNPFTVYFDANARAFDRRDAREVWVTEIISRDEFRARFPKADEVDWSIGGSGDAFVNDWWMEDSVRIAEYWYKEKRTKEIVQLSTGEVVDAEQFDPISDELAESGIMEVKRRKVEYDQVLCEIVSGKETLEGPTEWAGKFIPIIPVWGELTNIDGRDRYMGLTRTARDPQALYNLHRSVLVEAIANAPKSPFLATPAMVEGHERQWENIGVANDPVLFYNPDPRAPGAQPQRARPPDFPVSIANAQALDSDDIKAVTGIYDASLGARSNETSGRAIMARQREADVGTFDYVDNLTRAMKYQGEILIDLIPKVYDTERAIRILGEDGAEQFVKVNAEVYDRQTGQMVKVNDLSAAKFDVAVTVGPSYTTQRMEQAEILMQLSQNPAIGPLVADLVVKSLDLPGAEEVETRIRRTLLAQGLVDPDPERGEQPPPQPEGPPPEVALKEAELQQKGEIEARKLDLDGQKLQLDAQKLQLEVAKLEAETQKSQAEIQAMMAKAAAEVEAIRSKGSADTESSRAGLQAALTAVQAAQQAQASIVEQSAMTAEALVAMQNAIAGLGGPRRVSIVRGPDGRVSGAEVG